MVGIAGARSVAAQNAPSGVLPNRSDARCVEARRVIRLGNQIRRLRCDTGARTGRELLPDLSAATEEETCPLALAETLVCSHFEALRYLGDAVREPLCGGQLKELVGHLSELSGGMALECGSCLAEDLLAAEYHTGAELRSLHPGLRLPTTDAPAQFVLQLDPDWDRGLASSLLLLGATHLSAQEWRDPRLLASISPRQRDPRASNRTRRQADDGEPRALAMRLVRQHETFRRCRDSVSTRIALLTHQLHNATGYGQAHPRSTPHFQVAQRTAHALGNARERARLRELHHSHWALSVRPTLIDELLLLTRAPLVSEIVGLPPKPRDEYSSCRADLVDAAQELHTVHPELIQMPPEGLSAPLYANWLLLHVTGKVATCPEQLNPIEVDADFAKPINGNVYSANGEFQGTVSGHIVGKLHARATEPGARARVSLNLGLQDTAIDGAMPVTSRFPAGVSGSLAVHSGDTMQLGVGELQMPSLRQRKESIARRGAETARRAAQLLGMKVHDGTLEEKAETAWGHGRPDVSLPAVEELETVNSDKGGAITYRQKLVRALDGSELV